MVFPGEIIRRFLPIPEVISPRGMGQILHIANIFLGSRNFFANPEFN
jgi:hypothetical protein